MVDKGNPTATALGVVGTVLWCVQLIPQVIYNYRRKDCTGLPFAMMFLWAASGVPFGIYFMVQRANMALQIQPQLFTFFCLCAFWQTLYYPPVKLGWKWATLIVAIQAGVSAGIELGATLPLRPLYDRGTEWPNLIPGIIAAVLLAVGLLPPYPELWKAKGQVVGINFVFLFLDSSGAVFNIVSVCMQNGDLDILGIVLYCVVLVLELGIFTSHIIWMIRVKYFGLVPVEQEKADDRSMYTDTEIQDRTFWQKAVVYLFGEMRRPDPPGEVSDNEALSSLSDEAKV